MRGIGVGVPAPVSFATGQPIRPPIMPWWDGFPWPRWFAERYDVPVLVDNDVNIMALGEHWAHWRETEHFLFIKVGTGIGGGDRRRPHPPRRPRRGGRHRAHPGRRTDEVLCGCGNVNCLEAVAGGGAIARRLTELGLDAGNSRDVVGSCAPGSRRPSRWCARPGA